MGKARIIWLDELKGVLILLVLMGHIFPENTYVRIWIYSFHLPAFLIVSGVMLFVNQNWQNRSHKQNVVRIAERYLYPYFSFSFVVFIYLIIIKFVFTSDFEYVKSFCFNFITGESRGGLWYLFDLFVAEFIFLSFYKKARIISGLTIILSIIINIVNNGLLKVYCNRVIICLAFILIGFWGTKIYYDFKRVRKYQMPKIVRNSCAIYIVLLLLLSAVAQINGNVDIHFMKLNNIFIFIVLSVIETIMLVLLFKHKKHEYKLLSFFGKNSLIVLATNVNFPIISIVSYFVERVFYVRNYFFYFSVFILACVCELIIVIFIKKFAPYLISPMYKIKTRGSL